MIKVRFHDTADDSLLKFAVIVSRYQNQWVFCKHKNRDTYEFPGGHREEGEDIHDTAQRELWEETGAVEYDMLEISIYSVIKNGVETYGMLYFADLYKFEKLPALEIEKVEFFSALPDQWTYPKIQPILLEKVKDFI